MIFVLATVLVVLPAAPARRAEAASYSNATLYSVGTYGYFSDIVYTNFGFTVAYITFLSSGSILGVINGGTAGRDSTIDFSGTYSVNSNCTLTVGFSSGNQTQGIIVSGGNEVWLDQTNGGVTIFFDLKKE
jgi:hypothetical protein